jgi:hypothetical protein
MVALQLVAVNFFGQRLESAVNISDRSDGLRSGTCIRAHTTACDCMCVCIHAHTVVCAYVRMRPHSAASDCMCRWMCGLPCRQACSTSTSTTWRLTTRRSRRLTAATGRTSRCTT